MDNQGIPLAVSQAECGNFNDVYRVEQTTSQLFETMQNSGLSTDGLFLNADVGFDTKLVRNICDKNDIIANIAFNKRNSADSNSILLDELLYKNRFCIERRNAWLDSNRSVLNRFDRLETNWMGMLYVSFIVTFLKKIKKLKV